MYQEHPAVLENRLHGEPARDEIQPLDVALPHLQLPTTTSDHHTSTREDPIHDRKSTS
jgi:hypothetical protein